MSSEEQYITLRTYNKVWKFERKIYSIEGLKLLFPVSPSEALYFAVGFLISLLFSNIVPFYSRLNFAIRFGLIPYGIMKLLLTQKLDGKLPHKFFYDYLIYLISPKVYSRFKPIEEVKIIKFVTNIVYREEISVNKTNLVLRKKSNRKGKGDAK